MEWIEWNGGERPVPNDAMVQVKYRGGNVAPNCDATVPSWRVHNWWHAPTGGSWDVVAYRVVSP